MLSIEPIVALDRRADAVHAARLAQWLEHPVDNRANADRNRDRVPIHGAKALTVKLAALNRRNRLRVPVALPASPRKRRCRSVSGRRQGARVLSGRYCKVPAWQDASALPMSGGFPGLPRASFPVVPAKDGTRAGCSMRSRWKRPAPVPDPTHGRHIWTPAFAGDTVLRTKTKIQETARTFALLMRERVKPLS